MSAPDPEYQSGVLTEKKQEATEPPMYKVLLHNDDYTTMEFVVIVLEKIFQRTTAEATRIMLNVHHQGVGVAGVYTREIAETKIAVVHDLAARNEYPLRCSMEKA